MRISYLKAFSAAAGSFVIAAGLLAAQTVSAREPSAQKGEELFKENCAACHKGAAAEAALGKLDREAYDEGLAGHPKIPALETLSSEDLGDIYAYLKTQAES